MQLRGRKWVAFESDTWGFDTWGWKGPKNLCVDPDSHPETRPELAKLHNRVLISEKTFLEHTLRRLVPALLERNLAASCCRISITQRRGAGSIVQRGPARQYHLTVALCFKWGQPHLTRVPCAAKTLDALNLIWIYSHTCVSISTRLTDQVSTTGFPTKKTTVPNDHVKAWALEMSFRLLAGLLRTVIPMAMLPACWTCELKVLGCWTQNG